MKCAYCKCLEASNKKEGCVAGCSYYCKLKKEYINDNNENCDRFERIFKDEKIVENMMEDGKVYDDIPFSAETLFVFFIIQVVLGLIMGVF